MRERAFLILRSCLHTKHSRLEVVIMRSPSNIGRDLKGEAWRRSAMARPKVEPGSRAERATINCQCQLKEMHDRLALTAALPSQAFKPSGVRLVLVLVLVPKSMHTSGRPGPPGRCKQERNYCLCTPATTLRLEHACPCVSSAAFSWSWKGGTQ